mmetsp:Transcript_38429/g.44781  ORF Transcript_38429/g.44781 Transcript_38429/m.44781 type:complete len:297 (+) Transcript_38429:3-893(+)
MKLVQFFIRSKLGADVKSCEDAWIVTPNFACVIDGATSATGSRWTKDNITGGKWASQILKETIPNLERETTVRDAVNQLTDAIQTAYESEDGVLEHMNIHREDRATASLVVYSSFLDQIFFVGDCQAAFVNHKDEITNAIQPTKYNDQVMSSARSMYLQLEIAKGKTKEELRSDPEDEGRTFIQPLLVGQKMFQNNPDAPAAHRYWTMDGFPISDSGIETYDVPLDTKHIILASDGYPTLFPSLEKTEEDLMTIIQEDPLMFDKHLSTKGVRPGAESFDDRTYVCIDIRKNIYERK